MSVENDSNVIYGGDYNDSKTPIDENRGSLGAVILSNLSLGGNKPCLINGLNDKFWTYNDLRLESIAMAKILYSSGLRQSDTISILSENRFEFAAIAFGAIFLNAIVAPLNVTYTERELNHAFDLSKPKFVFTSAYSEKIVIKICNSLEYVKKIITIDGAVSEGKVETLDFLKASNQDADFDVEAFLSNKVNIHDQVSFIMMSSGTTGFPKAVQQTQENVLSTIQSYRDLFVIFRKNNEGNTVLMGIAGWFHGFGFITVIIVACLKDTSFVFIPKFEEEAFYRAIEKNKVTNIVIVPTIMIMFAKSPLFEKYDLSSIKDMICSTAPLSKEVEDQVKKRFKQEIVIRQGYGLTEVVFGTLTSLTILKPGSVGSVMKGIYAKVIDDKGNSLGPNKVGELCFKSLSIMKGYLNDPQATSEMIDKDGWLHTGDLGYYDEDFQFFIVDRLKELIKYKGFQVPPAELEALLIKNPKIKDCGVIGIPDEVSGELPMAFVVKQDNVELTEQEIKDFVAKNASNAKWLRGGVKFINLIPKNSSGKILRRELRDLYKTRYQN